MNTAAGRLEPIQLFDPASCTYAYVLAGPGHRGGRHHRPRRRAARTRPRRAAAARVAAGLVDRDPCPCGPHHQCRPPRRAHGHAHGRAAGCHIGSASLQLQDGERLRFGGEELLALHTPGRTAGSMCYLWRRHVFTGDTLLVGRCGLSDFQSGSAEDLYRSITGVLFALPGDTIVWPGHDYRGHTHSTIEQERHSNPRIAGKTLAEFEATMDDLNLPRPKRIDEAVPANLASGLRQDAGASDAPRPAQGYAGDVPPQLAWEWWQSGAAVLVDVRSDAEREWVGFVPGAVPLAWKQWPGMQPNPGFDEGVRTAVPAGKKVLFLCRSGVRSIAAAKRATELGFEAWNVLEGFEGDPDEHGHRGRRGGWRLRGLPWRQN